MHAVSGRVALAWLGYGAVVGLLLLLVDPSGRCDNPATAPGLAVWRRENCEACHSIYGLGGHVGPDLTNAIRRRGQAYVSLITQYGKGEMPPLGLSDSDVDAVVNYLIAINELGEYPIKTLHGNSFGNNKE